MVDAKKQIRLWVFLPGEPAAPAEATRTAEGPAAP